MQLLGVIGKGLSLLGGAQSFIPNLALDALHLPHFTSPLEMAGDFLQKGKKYQFGRAEGQNAELGALASVAYLAPTLFSGGGSLGTAAAPAAAAPAAAAPAAAPSLGSSITKSFLTNAAASAGSSLFQKQQQPDQPINPMPRRPINIAQAYNVNPGMPMQYGSLADNPVVRSFLRY